MWFEKNLRTGRYIYEGLCENETYKNTPAIINIRKIITNHLIYLFMFLNYTTTRLQ